jgi:hypothetical protein
MTILQLDPPIPMTVLGKGDGYAIAMLDYSQEHHIHFVVAMDETGEIWTMPNPMVRMQKNITLGRIINKNENKE